MNLRLRILTGCLLCLNPLAHAATSPLPIADELLNRISQEKILAQSSTDGHDGRSIEANSEANSPPSEFRTDLMFKFLIAEFAKHNKLFDLSAETLLDILRNYEREDIAEMTANAANAARRLDIALEAAKVWFRLKPTSTKARFVYLTVVLRNNEFEAARPLISDYLNNRSGEIDKKIQYIADLVSNAQNRAEGYQFLLGVTDGLEDSYVKSLLLGQSALKAGMAVEANVHADHALKINSRSEDAALLKAAALRQLDDGSSMVFLYEFLEAHPEAGSVRASVVGDLVREERYEDAIPHLKRLANDEENGANVHFTLALVFYELERFNESQDNVHRALSLGYEDKASAYFQLGLIDEQLNMMGSAANWFASVPRGTRFVEAQKRLAKIKFTLDGLKPTIDYLTKRSLDNPEYFVVFVELQGMIYREAGAMDDYFRVLDEGLAKRPKEPSLLYSSAMAAEQLGLIDVLELRLRRLIELEPDNAQAFNALGYTLADKTDRFGEAKALLVRALELSPDDPVFIDSMGWIEFKLKEYERSITLLRRAYSLERHPEIAAHLGEALWALGKEGEAKSVWTLARDEFPDNDVLIDTLYRYGVD
jgi:tetratricopeptide (TPR) repeat protein